MPALHLYPPEHVEPAGGVPRGLIWIALAATGVPAATAILFVPPQLIPGGPSGGVPSSLGQEILTFVDT